MNGKRNQDVRGGGGGNCMEETNIKLKELMMKINSKEQNKTKKTHTTGCMKVDLLCHFVPVA